MTLVLVLVLVGQELHECAVYRDRHAARYTAQMPRWRTCFNTWQAQRTCPRPRGVHRTDFTRPEVTSVRRGGGWWSIVLYLTALNGPAGLAAPRPCRVTSSGAPRTA